MDVGQIVLIACVVVFTLIAAFCDWRIRKLPNVLTVPAFAAAIVFHVGYGAATGGFAGAGSHFVFAIAGFGTGFGILLVLWLIGGGGGGDVKFMGALGAWLGAEQTLYVFLISAVLIAIGAIGILALQFINRGMVGTKSRFLDSGKAASDQKRKEKKIDKATAEMQRKVHRRLMPFGVPAALATWMVLAMQWYVQ